MILIIAEKPSVANDIAKIVGANEKGSGYKKGNGYIVSWCVGHLITLSDPEAYSEKFANWNLEDLPIIPNEFKTEVIKYSAKQYKILKDLMLSNEIKELICATDAGREGELIFRLVYDKVGCKKPFRRLWISSLEEESIKKGLSTLKKSSEYDNLYKAARSRQKADWIAGMNLTRLYTKKYNTLLSTGRVQTPTVNLIVKRHLEVNEFKPEIYYKLIADLGSFEASKKVNTLKEAEIITDLCKNKQALVDEVNQENKKNNAPALYDLTTLQREANRLLGYSAKQTLEILQNLYESKLTTYPRTDSRYITNDMASSVSRLIDRLIENKLFNEITLNDYNLKEIDISKLVNDKKVTDHTAILPTESLNIEKYKSLPTAEKNILTLIMFRTIIAPYTTHEYKTTKVVVNIENEIFEATGKEIIVPGFKEIEKLINENLTRKLSKAGSEQSESVLPRISKGEKYLTKDIKTEEKHTSPPKLYTEDTLLSAMETAGRDIKEEELREAIKGSGLGTPATRANIIENIINREYIERKGKSLAATEKGIKFISLIDDQIKEPLLTAEWEYQLFQIEQGLLDENKFMENISKLIKSIVEEAKKNNIDQPVFSNKNIIGICPKCEKNIIDYPKAYSCESGKGGCGFVIWKTIAGKKISETQAKKLISKGETDIIKGFKSKKATLFNARIILKNDKTTGFKFD